MADARRDAQLRRAPIVDVTVVFGRDPAPPGYFKLTETVTGLKADLNPGAGARSAYLCVKKQQPRSQLPPEPSAAFSASPLVPPPPPPPAAAAAGRNNRIDGASGGAASERFHPPTPPPSPREAELPPVVALCVILPERREIVPPGFMRCAAGTRTADL